MLTSLPIFIKYLLTTILGAMPIIELRYAVIIADRFFALNILPAFIFGLIGNILPIFFIVKYAKPLFDFFGRWKFFKKIIDWATNKATKKIAESNTIQKFAIFSLFLFVAVPIPTTGAWVGSLIANFLEIPAKKAVPVIILGVITAGIIMVIVNGGVSYLLG